MDAPRKPRKPFWPLAPPNSPVYGAINMRNFPQTFDFSAKPEKPGGTLEIVFAKTNPLAIDAFKAWEYPIEFRVMMNIETRPDDRLVIFIEWGRSRIHDHLSACMAFINQFVERDIVITYTASSEASEDEFFAEFFK